MVIIQKAILLNISYFCGFALNTVLSRVFEIDQLTMIFSSSLLIIPHVASHDAQAYEVFSEPLLNTTMCTEHER